MSFSRLPLVILELANSHGGDFTRLLETVQAFSGIDYPQLGMKFQVFSADTIALPDFSHYSLYKSLEFTPAQWSEAIAKAAGHYRVFLDIFDLYAVDVLKRNLSAVQGIKLQASVIENTEVLEALAALDLQGTEVICNISGHSADTLPRIVRNLDAALGPVSLQIGFQAYPTALADTSLNKIAILRAILPGRPIGLAEHIDGSDHMSRLVPTAVWRDVESIEKHICLDRETTQYDSFSASHPDEVARMCRDIQDLSTAYLSEFTSSSELTYLENTVQIPLAATSLPATAPIADSQMVYRRTAQRGLTFHEICELRAQRFVLGTAKSQFEAFNLGDFRAARTGVIVACRLKSTRLAQKALEPIGDMSSIERCLLQCKAAQTPDLVVLATSNLQQDRMLRPLAKAAQVEYFEGDPDDVIRRFIDAAKAHEIDVIVRITGDNPLICHEWIDRLVESHFATGAEYSGFENPTLGLASEVINVAALERVIDRLGEAPHSEYMTWYFTNNPEHFRINILNLRPEEYRDWRLTLDYDDDLEVIRKVIELSKNKSNAISLGELYDILDANPSLSKINGKHKLRFKSDAELIDMLNKKTKF